MTWEGIIPRKRRLPFAKFLNHDDPRIRALAEQMQSAVGRRNNGKALNSMKRLTIDWHALEMAFDDPLDEFAMDCLNYLDMESGEVVFVGEEISGAVGCITDNGDASRFEEIPNFDSHELFEWMRNFIETIGDDAIQRRLDGAISQRKPFRRFRDELAGDRRLERQWHEFEAASQREAIIKWLNSIGVEATNPDSSTYDPPPLPDLRNIMFAEVRRFVRLASEMEGIKRIALIGSLAADKEFPKDIDLLVTVSDDCDLAPLAELGRQLNGHMNSHGAGADVFLASERDEYLGRTCPWRDCGPGVRASCDAMHCGLRLYLHDDFSSVRLKEDVIAQPRVLLWPDMVAAADVPADVHEQLR